MIQKLKKSWQEWKESEPGHRFQDRYERRRRESHGSLDAGKVINIVAGLTVAALGLFLIPMPGPGFLVAGLGMGLIGCEFQPIARLLDGAEVWLRKLKQHAMQQWRQFPIPVKVVIILIALGVALAIGFGIYRMFFAK